MAEFAALQTYNLRQCVLGPCDDQSDIDGVSNVTSYRFNTISRPGAGVVDGVLVRYGRGAVDSCSGVDTTRTTGA